MKAMVLAAGVGSRLRPITDKIPKALVDVGGAPLLEIVIRRLMKAGVDEIVINVHHMADKIVDFVKSKKNFGIRIEFSREEKLLETGGGLKKAAWFFDDGKPFFFQAADVFTEMDLAGMYRSHMENPALATLAVHPREAGRRFLFDRNGLLCGWESVNEGVRKWAGKPVENAEPLNFDVVHVISPDIFPKMTETGVFGMTEVYLRLAGQGEKIRAFRTDPYFWATIGDPERLEALRVHVKEKGLKI